MNTIPILKVGKYKGIPIDQVPNSYLNWMLAHDFPEEYLKYARKKVESNTTSKIQIDVTRHAIDRFSLRYMHTWKPLKVGNDKYEGLGSYIARRALQALTEGVDISKNRHQDDELRMKYDEITYIFNKKGEFKVLITVI